MANLAQQTIRSNPSQYTNIPEEEDPPLSTSPVAQESPPQQQNSNSRIVGIWPPQWQEDFQTIFEWGNKLFGTAGKGLEQIALWPLILHCGTAVMLCWLAGQYQVNILFVFLLATLYLSEVAKRQKQRLVHLIRHEERKAANQKLPMSDVETVRWVNGVLERMWPVFLEQFISSQLLPAVAPWFFEKYKPWHVKRALLQRIYLGSAPPLIATARIVPGNEYDDHCVLEMGGEFVASKEMTALIAGQPRRRLGFGLWASCHVSKVVVEGKIRVGVKFSPDWPYVSRLRICFPVTPYISLAAKPILNFGVDVTELPGIAGWLDRVLCSALEKSMVAPNMMLLDVKKLMAFYMTKIPKQPSRSSANAVDPGEFICVSEMPACAKVLVEVLEAKHLKAADANGLSDPYVKGALGAVRFRTRVKRRTLNPMWFEEFSAAVVSWDRPNLLVLRVLDKDMLKSDYLGYCVVDLNVLHNKQIKSRNRRTEFWENLRGVKTGRLRLAITITTHICADPPTPPPAAASSTPATASDAHQQLTTPLPTSASASAPSLTSTLPHSAELVVVLPTKKNMEEQNTKKKKKKSKQSPEKVDRPPLPPNATATDRVGSSGRRSKSWTGAGSGSGSSNDSAAGVETSRKQAPQQQQQLEKPWVSSSLPRELSLTSPEQQQEQRLETIKAEMAYTASHSKLHQQQPQQGEEQNLEEEKKQREGKEAKSPLAARNSHGKQGRVRVEDVKVEEPSLKSYLEDRPPAEASPAVLPPLPPLSSSPQLNTPAPWMSGSSWEAMESAMDLSIKVPATRSFTTVAAISAVSQSCPSSPLRKELERVEREEEGRRSGGMDGIEGSEGREGGEKREGREGGEGKGGGGNSPFHWPWKKKKKKAIMEEKEGRKGKRKEEEEVEERSEVDVEEAEGGRGNGDNGGEDRQADDGEEQKSPFSFPSSSSSSLSSEGEEDEEVLCSSTPTMASSPPQSPWHQKLSTLLSPKGISGRGGIPWKSPKPTPPTSTSHRGSSNNGEEEEDDKEEDEEEEEDNEEEEEEEVDAWTTDCGEECLNSAMRTPHGGSPQNQDTGRGSGGARSRGEEEFGWMEEERELVELIGVEPELGFLSCVRPGMGGSVVGWKPRTGGRRSEAEAMTGFMEGYGRSTWDVVKEISQGERRKKKKKGGERKAEKEEKKEEEEKVVEKVEEELKAAEEKKGEGRRSGSRKEAKKMLKDLDEWDGKEQSEEVGEDEAEEGKSGKEKKKGRGWFGQRKKSKKLREVEVDSGEEEDMDRHVETVLSRGSLKN